MCTDVQHLHPNPLHTHLLGFLTISHYFRLYSRHLFSATGWVTVAADKYLFHTHDKGRTMGYLTHVHLFLCQFN